MNVAKHEAKQMTERELVEGCIVGKKKCQELLYQLFAGRIMNICLRYLKSKAEAEDALHDIFIKIFLNLQQFKFESTLAYWVKRVTINTILTKLKRKKMESLTFDISEYNEEELSVTMDEDPDVPMEVLVKMVQALPYGQRMVFNMREVEGYEVQEVADTLQCSNITVRTQLFKAKNKLKDNIENWLKGEQIE